MIRLRKLWGVVGAAALMAAPVAGGTGSPVFAAMDCGIGQRVEACAGAQNVGNGEWQMAAIASLAGAESGTVSITGGILDIPYYDVFSGNTTSSYTGPGKVTSWQVPANGAANVFVLPTQSGVAGRAMVTVNLPGTMNENGTYAVSLPALELGHAQMQIRGGPIPLTLVGQGANTIPVTYSANEPVFGLSKSGPWVKSLLVPPNTASWFNEPNDPAGLVATATPHYRDGNPYANGTAWQDVPGGEGMSMLAPAASTVPTPQPTPEPVTRPTPTPKPVGQPKPATKPKPVTKAPSKPVVPAKTKSSPVAAVLVLRLRAPSQTKAGQVVPITVRFTQNDKPLAGQTVRLTTSAGRLSHAVVITNAQGVAHDAIANAPAGQIHVTAKRGALVAGAVITVVAPFPWWLVLLLVLAVALLVLMVLRRRRQRTDDGSNEPEP